MLDSGILVEEGTTDLRLKSCAFVVFKIVENPWHFDLFSPPPKTRLPSNKPALTLHQRNILLCSISLILEKTMKKQ